MYRPAESYYLNEITPSGRDSCGLRWEGGSLRVSLLTLILRELSARVAASAQRSLPTVVVIFLLILRIRVPAADVL